MSAPTVLPLFPLQAVLFPGGQLTLKVFEARYLDLVSRCVREDIPFGVVCLKQGPEIRASEPAVRFETLGVRADVRSVDADTPGILRVQCVGSQRFRCAQTRQEANGLWVADAVEWLADDPVLPLPPEFHTAAQALGRTFLALLPQHPTLLGGGTARLNETAWVANRWCELLPLPLAARQQLMALPDAVARLSLVDQYLRDKKLIG